MLNANRSYLKEFLSLPTDNLALKLEKLNENIDEYKEHKNKEKALENMVNFKVSPALKDSYGYAFENWKSSISKRPLDTLCFDLESLTKVLLGTGNASVHEFGFNLNIPWGVPFISGSTLKGLVSSFLAKINENTWWRFKKSGEKSVSQAEFFGGDFDNKSYIGNVTFFDAWMYPVDHWFVADIINVHHPKYYSGERLPDGTEDPKLVKIAALRPGLRFFLSIQGPKEYLVFIKKILARALFEDGIGGKTAVGYGRFEILKSEEEIVAEIKEKIKKAANARELLEIYKSNGKNEKMFSTFQKKIGDWEPEKILEPVYQKYAPLKILLYQIQQEKISDVKSLKTFKNQFEKQYKKYKKRIEESGQKISSTSDAQKIFTEIRQRWGLSIDELKNNWIIKDFAFGWDDILTSENAEEIILDLDKREWPPLDSLENAIKSMNFAEEIQTELLEMLKMKLEDLQ